MTNRPVVPGDGGRGRLRGLGEVALAAVFLEGHGRECADSRRATQSGAIAFPHRGTFSTGRGAHTSRPWQPTSPHAAGPSGPDRSRCDRDRGVAGDRGRDRCAARDGRGESGRPLSPGSAGRTTRRREDHEATGGTAVAISAKLDTEAGVTHLFAEADDRLGPVDILVNNAGQNFPLHPLAEMLAAPSGRRCSVTTSTRCSCARRRQRRCMRDRGGGAIVNIGSISASRPAERPQPLQQRQGRGPGIHPVLRAGARPIRHPGQFRLARADPQGGHREGVAGGRRALARQSPARPFGRAGGHRRSRACSWRHRPRAGSQDRTWSSTAGCSAARPYSAGRAAAPARIRPSCASVPAWRPRQPLRRGLGRRPWPSRRRVDFDAFAALAALASETDTGLSGSTRGPPWPR